MTKNLLALLVAAAISGAASAQSNVTVFGIVDVNVRNVHNGNAGSLWTESTDGLTQSRLGFRGVEDLAWFRPETLREVKNLRRQLRDRFGELWFEDRGAGELLRELWSAGQREPADELLRRLTGAELDFSALLD